MSLLRNLPNALASHINFSCNLAWNYWKFKISKVLSIGSKVGGGYQEELKGDKSLALMTTDP
jgi:hypothetical protein